ncbi:MAG: radical SAM protein [Candidatus Omnitrophica bacterium]|nr:radical SAM protein [Candidatus Omnitrophota bacterium]
MNWTDRCNVECFFCNNLEKNRAGLELNPKVVERVIREGRSKGLQSVRLSGGGEPLFHSHLKELLDILKLHKVRIENLTTNGLCLTRANCQSLIEAGLDEIIFSLNYADRYSYAEGMRTRPENFERSIQGVQTLFDTAAGMQEPLPVLIVAFSICRQTRKDIPRMYEIGLRLNADRIAFRNLHGIAQSQDLTNSDMEWLLLDLGRLIDQENDLSRLEFRFSNPVLQDYCMEKIAPRIDKSHVNAEVGSVRHCSVPWYSLGIRGNGDVYPCCNLLLDGPFPPLGNVNCQSLEEIWGGEPFRRFRQEMESVALLVNTESTLADRIGILPPVCSTPHACFLCDHLSDDDFYEEALRIRRKRRSVWARLWS